MNVKVISLSLDSSSIKGIEFDYFKAIDNKVVKSKYGFNKNVFNLIYGREPKNGEIGCSLSHFEVISDFYKNENSSSLIVLEDDAILEKDFHEYILKIQDTIKDFKPSIFILGVSKTKKENNLIHRIKWPLKNSISIGNKKFGFSDINHCGTVAYIINRSAAKIISEQNNIFWVADDWKIISNMGIDIYLPNKPLVYEDLNTISSIGNNICCYNSLKTNFKRNVTLILKGILCRI